MGEGPAELAMTDNGVDRLARTLAIWHEAIEQHNRLLRGIASALGLISLILGLMLYAVWAGAVTGGCH